MDSHEHGTPTSTDGVGALQNIEGAKDLLRAAAEIMREHRIAELDVSVAGMHISMKSGTVNAGVTGAVSPQAVEVEIDEEKSAEDEHVITAPMIGTFYVAPAPGEEPFVRPGDYIEEGQPIGIIEAMKIMNEIAADRSGEVLEVLAENGETVEFGSPLVRIRAT